LKFDQRTRLGSPPLDYINKYHFSRQYIKQTIFIALIWYLQ